MKNLQLVTKTSLLLCLLSSALMAKSVVRVVSVKGNVFAVNKGVTFVVQEGDFLDDFAEIMTDETSQVSFVDFHDHQFHVSRSSHIKLMNKIVELRAGNIWVQSKNKREDFSIQTSNSNSVYKDSEFLVSYQSSLGKSQLMVVNGNVEFSNILESHLLYTVSGGQFSFVDKKYEDGLPRNPTQTGFNSFKMAMGSFEGVKPMDKGFMDVMDTQLAANPVNPSGRSIASVQEGGAGQMMILSHGKKKTGKVLFISSVKKKNERTPASVREAKSYFKKVDKKKVLNGSELNNLKSKKPLKKAVVRNFGFSDLEEIKPSFPKKTTVEIPVQEKVENRRVPANRPQGGTVQEYEQRLFEKSFKKEAQDQTKHPSEVNELIDELKNYKDDFNKFY